ncbi:MAG TPA: hypothetical protein VF017_18110 [Thermoanaerobaculia bacterium]|nr:hypothetical protein [Thermoanaerobaculia bacterium]
MKPASVTGGKLRLLTDLDEAKASQTVSIPVSGPAGRPEDDRMVSLERRGLLTRGRGGVVEEILNEPPPRARTGASALQTLLEEREDGPAPP